MTAQKGSIAWIGIGKMGLPIAGRIAGAGYSVTAFDASTERLAMARQSGLSPAGSATEAVSGQSVVFTSLPDDAALRAALLSPPLATRNFESTFSCRQMAKDLDLILGAAHAVSVPLQLAAQVRETYGSLIAQGEGETDFIATVPHLERLSGLGEPEL